MNLCPFSQRALKTMSNFKACFRQLRARVYCFKQDEHTNTTHAHTHTHRHYTHLFLANLCSFPFFFPLFALISSCSSPSSLCLSSVTSPLFSLVSAVIFSVLHHWGSHVLSVYHQEGEGERERDIEEDSASLSLSLILSIAPTDTNTRQCTLLQSCVA